jgi:hypothetical protein
MGITEQTFRMRRQGTLIWSLQATVGVCRQPLGSKGLVRVIRWVFPYCPQPRLSRLQWRLQFFPVTILIRDSVFQNLGDSGSTKRVFNAIRRIDLTLPTKSAISSGNLSQA